jgi:hypothetical protein
MGDGFSITMMSGGLGIIIYALISKVYIVWIPYFPYLKPQVYNILGELSAHGRFVVYGWRSRIILVEEAGTGSNVPADSARTSSSPSP